MDFNWLDIVLALPLVYGVVRGLYNGFVQSIGSFIGMIIGIIVAYSFAESFSVQIMQWFVLTPEQSYPIAFILLFIVALLVCAAIIRLLDKFLSFVLLGWANKLLGGVFGLLKYALLLSVLINLVDTVDERIHFIPQEKKNESFLYKPVKAVVPTIMPYVHFYLDPENEAKK